jgi:hypothetical protein
MPAFVVMAVAMLVFSVLGAAALLVGYPHFTSRAYAANHQEATPFTLPPLPTASLAATEAAPTAQATLPAPAVIVATATPDTPALVAFVMPQVNVNLRSGPGMAFEIVGWVAEGQVVRVTGVSDDHNWWRMVCPNDTSDDCWITAQPQYTQPVTAGGDMPAVAGAVYQ